MENFDIAKKKFKKAFKEILSKENSYEIDEAALPAYSHKNPLIYWLFWARVKLLINLQ